MSEGKTFESKLYLVAQSSGFYDGTVQLPTGTKYAFPRGRGLYANKGPGGDWYRGDLVALDHDRFGEDARIDASVKPAGMDERSTIKPLELRLNPWVGGKADLIGSIWTSEGLFTVFADKANDRGQLVIRGSIKPALGKDAVRAREILADVAEQHGVTTDEILGEAARQRAAKRDAGPGTANNNG